MRIVTGLLVAALVLTAGFALADEKEKEWTPPLEGMTFRALDCSNAIPITCGETVSGDNTGYTNNVEYYSCVGWQETGGEVVYVFEIPAGTCYEVTLTLSNYTHDPDVFLLASCDENECVAYAHISSTSECLPSGTYYIVVDGYYSAPSGPFDLMVQCAECTCPEEPCCPSLFVCDVFDFNVSDNGFTTLPCGGNPVWAWGMLAYTIPDIACDDVPVTNVLATVVNGDYGDGAGETAVVGPYYIGDDCWCMELCHFYDTEAYYDGGNVKISTDGGATWTLITPARLYDQAGYSGNPCIPGEMAFTGHQFNTTWMRDCFDLTDYVGQEILVGFFFGSDSSVGYYPGWYIKWLKIGGNTPTSTEGESWGGVKRLFR